MERIETLKNMLQAAPGDAFLQHALALEYVKMGDDATARTYFENLLAQQPLYIGSYYHLAKLLERSGATAAAIQWYQKGMERAGAAGDRHAYNELQAALEDLLDE